MPRTLSLKAALRSTTTRLGVTGAVAAGTLAAVLGGTAPHASASTLSDQFAALRMCESSGNYATNTGNGYYGAYQFDLQTWYGMGQTQLPSETAPIIQDLVAAALWQRRGWEPWPACSAALGLR